MRRFFALLAALSALLTLTAFAEPETETDTETITETEAVTEEETGEDTETETEPVTARISALCDDTIQNELFAVTVTAEMDGLRGGRARLNFNGEKLTVAEVNGTQGINVRYTVNKNSVLFLFYGAEKHDGELRVLDVTFRVYNGNEDDIITFLLTEATFTDGDIEIEAETKPKGAILGVTVHDSSVTETEPDTTVTATETETEKETVTTAEKTETETEADTGAATETEPGTVTETETAPSVTSADTTEAVTTGPDPDSETEKTDETTDETTTQVLPKNEGRFNSPLSVVIISSVSLAAAAGIMLPAMKRK